VHTQIHAIADLATAPAPLARLASPTHRAHVANMVNAALLSEAAASSSSSSSSSSSPSSSSSSSSSASPGLDGKAERAASAEQNGHSSAGAHKEEDGGGTGIDAAATAAAAAARPLLERVLVHLAAARDALKEALADGRGSPFQLPALSNGKGGEGCRSNQVEARASGGL
jgi:hypothetical protein